MARIPGADVIYKLADQFRQRCLTEGNSLLWPDDHVWTADNITALRNVFEKRVDVEGGFYATLRAQLEDCSPEVHKVAADVIAFYQLPISSPSTPERKKSNVRTVISWKLAADNPDLGSLDRAYTEEADLGEYQHPGLMNPGQFYLAGIPWQICFYLEFARSALSSGADTSKVDVCKEIAAQLQKQRILGQVRRCSAARHILMHLLFPERFERMSSDKHKGQIVRAFEKHSGDVTDLDDAIYNIRRGLSQEYGENMDFYSKDIRPQWSPDAASGGREDQELESIAHLLETKSLTDTDILTKESWTSTVRPLTRAFLRRVAQKLDTKAKFPGGQDAASKRDCYDKLMVKLGKSLHAFVSVGTADEPGGDLEERLSWGLWAWGKTSEADEKQERLRELSPPDFSLRAIDTMKSQRFGGTTVLLYKSLPPKVIRARSANELADEIAADLRALIEGVLDEGITDAPAARPDELMHMTNMTREELLELESLLRGKKQIILEGPPGSGKTFVADKFARYFTGNPLEGPYDKRLRIIQFHQSYGYEDFIQGIRPETNEAGQLEYHVLDGVFKRLCAVAERNHDDDFIIIIDEINRGNISRILGEVLLLLEYRNMDVQLPYAKAGDPPFSIPPNVYIIGTMNTTDRSLAQIDYALRRRFYFYRMMPVVDGSAPVLQRWLRKQTISDSDRQRVLRLFINLNERVEHELGEHYQVGHSYFMDSGIGTDAGLRRAWDRAIMPLLEEYFYNRRDRLDVLAGFRPDRLLGKSAEVEMESEAEIEDL